MRTKSLALAIIVLGTLGLGCAVARADTTETVTLTLSPDAGVELGAVDADAGTATPAPPRATQPSDELANPVDDPLGAIDDVKQAKKQGWAFAILASVVMLTAGLARACQRWPGVPVLQWFAANKTALFVLTGLGTVGAAAFNALALGGSGWAVLAVAAGVALTLIAPPKPATAAQ